MDDFDMSHLQESRNEWCARLIGILSPLIQDSITSIFNEAWKSAVKTKEESKYLMVFQTLLSRIPKWNSVIVEEERKHIIEKSGCNYLEDLISCVHIIQLKALTCIRVGNKQKKIDISIPKLDTFLHKIFIHIYKKLYTNVYLFEINVDALQKQRNKRQFELLVQECILIAIRDSIPTEAIIRAYMDESVEEEEEITIEKIEEDSKEKDNSNKEKDDDNKEKDDDNKSDKDDNKDKENKSPEIVPSITNLDNEKVVSRLTFNEYDSVMDEHKNEQLVKAPKTLERLQEIEASRAIQRELDENNNTSDDSDILTISDESLDISALNFLDLDETPVSDDIPLLGVQEIL